jgi:hypothetical protein
MGPFGRGEEPWGSVRWKMYKCIRSIQRWIRKNAKPIDLLIKEKTKALENIQMGTNPYDKEREWVLKDEIHLLLEQEEIRMKQRAKID